MLPIAVGYVAFKKVGPWDGNINFFSGRKENGAKQFTILQTPVLELDMICTKCSLKVSGGIFVMGGGRGSISSSCVKCLKCLFCCQKLFKPLHFESIMKIKSSSS